MPVMALVTPGPEAAMQTPDYQRLDRAHHLHPFTDFKALAGGPLSEPTTRRWLFVITGCLLRAFYLLARWIVGWAGEHGFAEIDFGPGEYQYKRQLATTQRKVESGVAAGASWSGAIRRAHWALRRGVERLPQAQVAALAGKAMRRIDLHRALGAG